jgi:putative transposase
MKEWYTARELAELNLSDTPKTVRGIDKLANRENWPSRPRVGRGGGKEYPLSALPVSARDELAKRAGVNAIDITDIWEKAPAKVIRTVEQSNLKGWQLEVMNARAALLAEIDRLSIEFGRSRAIKVLIETAKENRLSPALMEHVSNANVRKGGNRTLSRRSVFNWIKARDEQGIVGLAPLPARKENASFPEWADTLFKLYNRPQKPS